MRITYDASADAVYLYLSDSNASKSIKTRQIDEDINIDFDELNQMVGVEVLGASERLRLSEIWQSIERIDTDWTRLTDALEYKKAHNIPITISMKGEKVWVEDIGYTYVTLRSKSGDLRKIKAIQLLGSQSKDPLIETLRKIGKYANKVKVK